MAGSHPPLRRVEYESLVDRGLLSDSRVELLLGALVDITPQGPRHADVVRRLAERLIRGLSTDVHIACKARLRCPMIQSRSRTSPSCMPEVIRKGTRRLDPKGVALQRLAR